MEVKVNRFDEITLKDLDAVHRRTETTAQAAAELGVSVASYKELCHIYDVMERDRWAEQLKSYWKQGAFPVAATEVKLAAITRGQVHVACSHSKSTREAARRLGVNIPQLIRLCEHFDVARPLKAQRHFTAEEVAEALANHPTIEKAALSLDCTPASLVHHAKKHGLHKRKRQYNGRRPRA